jgi:hypothetical protein
VPAGAGAGGGAYFIAEYRSARADVFFAVAMDGLAVSPDVLGRLFTAAAADLAPGDPSRAAILAAAR